ncbi:hypothetical protein AA313_de0206550 [Arthrobotrys entomopaga]|nr:hypothetical protein AA313_de0206550 [Arthrobotrys entomopaga]
MSRNQNVPVPILGKQQRPISSYPKDPENRSWKPYRSPVEDCPEGNRDANNENGEAKRLEKLRLRMGPILNRVSVAEASWPRGSWHSARFWTRAAAERVRGGAGCCSCCSFAS